MTQDIQTAVNGHVISWSVSSLRGVRRWAVLARETVIVGSILMALGPIVLSPGSYGLSTHLSCAVELFGLAWCIVFVLGTVHAVFSQFGIEEFSITPREILLIARLGPFEWRRSRLIADIRRIDIRRRLVGKGGAVRRQLQFRGKRRT